MSNAVDTTLNSRLTLRILPDQFMICRLAAKEKVPDWVPNIGSLVAVVRTADELSIVCPERAIADESKKETGWRAFKVVGPLDFSLTGVLSSIATPLAKAKISIFAVSTFDTDYILVKKEALGKAMVALSEKCTVIAE